MIRISQHTLLAVCAGLTIGMTSASCLAWWPGGHGYQPAPARSHEIIDYIKTGYHANSMWPYPYVCPDRVYAQEPFVVMTSNGWRRQNLLGSHHFNAESTKLTRAGELKVRWILTQTPPQYRKIFVERAGEPAVTDLRVATARNFAESASIDDTQLIVQDTHLMSQGRSAAMVDTERSTYIESRQSAVLPFLPASAATTSQ